MVARSRYVCAFRAERPVHPLAQPKSCLPWHSVAIDGTYVVAGAPNASVAGHAGAGAAYVLHYNGSSWVFSAKLTANPPATNAHFGSSVSIDGTRILVGTSGAHNAWVFRRTGTTWAQDERLDYPSVNPQNFAESVSISGSTLLIGDKGNTVSNHASAGSAYFYTADSSGSDSCSGATLVFSGSYTGCNSNATNDGDCKCGASSTSPDVWFAYTAPCFGFVTMDTSGSAIDTILSVHTGCPGTAANQIVCNDDVNYPTNKTSSLTFLAQSGTQYLIRATTYNTSPTGSFNLHISNCHSCPADFNQNGTVDVADIFAFLKAWFAKTITADFTGDNNVTVTDIFAFLRAWFAKCA